MRRLRIWALALCAVMAVPAIASSQVPVVGPSTYTYTTSGQSNTWACYGGQSSFALTVPTGLTGTFTVTVSQTSGGTFVNPPWSYAPGVATYTNTVTNSGSLTVNLGSFAYVRVADTTYSSGAVMISGVCSAAVAVVPPSSGGSSYAFNPTLPIAIATPSGNVNVSCPNCGTLNTVQTYTAAKTFSTPVYFGTYCSGSVASFIGAFNTGVNTVAGTESTAFGAGCSGGSPTPLMALDTTGALGANKVNVGGGGNGFGLVNIGTTSTNNTDEIHLGTSTCSGNASFGTDGAGIYPVADVNGEVLFVTCGATNALALDHLGNLGLHGSISAAGAMINGPTSGTRLVGEQGYLASSLMGLGFGTDCVPGGDPTQDYCLWDDNNGYAIRVNRGGGEVHISTGGGLFFDGLSDGPICMSSNSVVDCTSPAGTCTATSVPPCKFAWTCTMSSGACTTTQAVPASSTCNITPGVTTIASTTNMIGYWAPPPVSTTLTVHVHDELSTATSLFSGVGSCV